VKRVRNLIAELQNDNGEVVKGRQATSEVMFGYFKDRWRGTSNVLWDGDLSCINRKL